MSIVNNRSSQSIIPRYQENGPLQIIAFSGVPYIIFHFVRIIFFYAGMSKAEVFNTMFPNFGLSTLEMFQHKYWTVLTYGWLHHGFWEWFTNMIWVYCFGAVLQIIGSYKQVIPVFVYGLLFGGCFFLLSQFIPNAAFIPKAGEYFMGAQAGVTALGVAALSFAPAYKVRIAPGFTIPLVLIVCIYLLLNIVVYVPLQLNTLALCLGGALAGVGYAQLVKNNFRPGEWVYDSFEKWKRKITPDEFSEKKSGKRMEILRTMYEAKKGISQKKIDELLDKINEHGYHTLSREEKELLISASKE